MRTQRTHLVTRLPGVLFILSIILAGCATLTPVVPGEVQILEAQTEVEIPGGLMYVEDSTGLSHPVLVFDYQIQSRLVVGAEYAECVEAGECEPVAETDYPLAPAGVDWYQAQAYCSYLGGRLPTEAELVRASGGGEDSSDCGGELISQEGFGEWVYDWDDPDYYNDSLVTNPFGPMYGDIKVAMGLDLDAASEAMGKYWVKLDEIELDHIKLEEIKLEEIKLDHIKLEEIKLEEIKLEEIKFDLYKFFSDGGWQYSNEAWHYSIKFEHGKFSINATSADMDKSGPGQGPDFPRMAMLPDMSNPLVGFRCVTEGAALTYAPICTTQSAAQCSLPTDEMQTISLQLAEESGADPNFQIINVNCPKGGEFDLTISHELPPGEEIVVVADGEECDCQEYADYPGKLYCSCPSPGAGVKTEIEACVSGEDFLISMDEFCPDGSRFDLQSGGCIQVGTGIPLIYSLAGDEGGTEASSCPSGSGIPVPNYGVLGLAVASVEGLEESEVPEGDPWELFSLSDGSGMCPPGYGYNDESGCCTPLAEGNYDCEPDEYFDAGLKQCLPMGWDGCGPCQELNAEGVCVYNEGQDFVSFRCNVDNDGEGIDYDEYGRPQESSEGCGAGSYLDPDLGLCLETRDGCALGYYLDPKTGTCRPITGPESPCLEGYTYNSQIGCCVPSPGTGESECPEGTEYDGVGCSILVDGCPPTHYYDEETDSCLLREPGECPEGTSPNLIGRCTPDEPGVCPGNYTYDPGTDSCYRTGSGLPVCGGDKLFDLALGFCGSNPSGTGIGGGGTGRADLQDLSEVEIAENETPDLRESCFDPESALVPLIRPIESPDAIFQCLILSANKTFQSGQGICLPELTGDGDTEHYFTVEIEAGRIASITRVYPDPIDPASAEAPTGDATECGMQLVFGEKYGPDADDDEDDDSSRDPVSGTLPGGSACTLNLVIDAGSLFNLQGCTTLELTVPYCFVAPTPEPSDKCADLEFGVCNNTPGCGWSLNQNKCVVDNCTGVGDEKSCELIAGCIWQAGICQLD